MTYLNKSSHNLRGWHTYIQKITSYRRIITKSNENPQEKNDQINKHCQFGTFWCYQALGRITSLLSSWCIARLCFYLLTVYFKKQRRASEKITLWILNHVCLLTRKFRRENEPIIIWLCSLIKTQRSVLWLLLDFIKEWVCWLYERVCWVCQKSPSTPAGIPYDSLKEYSESNKESFWLHILGSTPPLEWKRSLKKVIITLRVSVLQWVSMTTRGQNDSFEFTVTVYVLLIQ